MPRHDRSRLDVNTTRFILKSATGGYFIGILSYISVMRGFSRREVCSPWNTQIVGNIVSVLMT